MVTVEFLGPISRPNEEFEVSNLKELSIELKKDEVIKEWLPKLAIAVNDRIIKDIDFTLKDGDKISLLPPVCGG